MSLGGGISSIFGGIGGIASSSGLKAAAAAYGKAATIARQNANLTDYSTKIQEAQLERKIEQTTGAETAATGAANLQMAGSANDLMRDSLQQGALAKSVTMIQGAINRNAFQQQAYAYDAMAASAKAAASSSLLGGIGGIIGGVLSLF